MRHTFTCNEQKEVSFGIHEVYYRSGKVVSWTGPVDLIAATAKELAVDLCDMLEAFKMPVLDTNNNDVISENGIPLKRCHYRLTGRKR